MEDRPGHEGFSEQQRSGLDARRADHDRTLEAMHRLEWALAEAAPGREQTWRDHVLEALSVLEAATGEEADNAQRPDSLLSDLAYNQPRLRNRASALRLQYAKVRDTIASLRQELNDGEDGAIDYADIRQRLSWVLTALRHQRARESDLIYEAYYDAFKVDLRTPGEKGTP
jgi:hypothetical protein